jgi:hypothetical protein
VGASALSLIAFTEIVAGRLDDSYRPAIADLASFLRSQQRPDGELMHLFDRTKNVPVDVQYLFYTGEAAFALARAGRITNDFRDTSAAGNALSYITRRGWNFFGSRYYVSEEHWTCQAVSELMSRAPNFEALEFCLRWHEVQRRLQQGEEDSPFDADGAFSFGPLNTPRTTPASSRGEAAGAALWALKVGIDRRERESYAKTIDLLDSELRRAMAFVMRTQFRGDSSYLFAHPELANGAIPASAVDWQVRIDYVQHAGSMMLRWLELSSLDAGKRPTSSP